MDEVEYFATAQLGTVKIDPSSLINFSEGIPGFEQFTHYLILTIEKYVPFQWLQSIEEPKLSLPIIQPALLYPEYNPTISFRDLQMVKLERFEDAEIYFITTIGQQPNDVTVNLRAPLVVNRKERLGKQCIVTETSFSLRYPILTNK